MTVQQYSIIINAFLDFFPDDRIDIQYTPYFPELEKYIADYSEGKEIPENILQQINNLGVGAVQIITYYPSITLTNENGNTHTITDVYVKTSLPELDIYLTRTSYTQAEVNVGYTHSHVPSRHMGDFALFCTGSPDTIINRIKSNVITQVSYSNINKERFDINNFTNAVTAFIIEEQRILDVESLDGIPHIKMSLISNGSNETIPISVEIKHYISLYSAYGRNRSDIANFIKYYLSLQLDDFIYDGRCWQLDCSDAEFISRVTRVAKTCKYVYKKEALFEDVIVKDGLYYEKSRNNNSLRNSETHWTFKGNKLPIKIIGKQETLHYKRILKRPIINYLYELLLNLINGIYASRKFKDCMHSRIYKITSKYLKQM